MASNYYGTIPNIQQAYQNDPRTRLANSMIATGTSTAPVAQGGWAVTDGLARAAQAILGSVVQNKQDKKYAARESEYMAGLRDAAGLAGQQQPQPNPAAVNPSGIDQAANALSGGAAGPLPGRVNVPQPGAIRPVELPPSIPAMNPPMSAQPPMGGGGGAPSSQMAPQAMPQGLQRPAFDPGFPMAEGASAPIPQAGPIGGGTGPKRGASLDSRALYFNGIVPIEGGTDKRGRFRTSPKGAIGPGQVMPGTAPEAAKLAGVEFDDWKYRNDAEYNNLLGHAYYAKQLQDFGDPVLAAAAYNGGPGRVQRALRQARTKGGDWTSYLPAETRTYVSNFISKVGDGGGGGTGGQPVVGDVPQMGAEPVPNAPAPPPAEMPAAPQLPDQVQTDRIAIAQRMLASGNPDLVLMAQEYLGKGLDEQQQARILANQQQFQQNQTGYQAGLSDWTGARNDQRNFGYGQVRDAQQRNFGRETQNNANEFRAGQSALDRAYGSSEREATQSFNAAEAQRQRDFLAQQNQLDREATLAKTNSVEAKKQQFFYTPTGAKMLNDTQEEMNKNSTLINQYEEFMQLNREQATGGLTGYVPGGWNSKLDRMTQIANDNTFKELGGLGTAISDGDRQFVQQANISTGTNPEANTRAAKARIGALRRVNDYQQEFLNAYAEGNVNDFAKSWSMFINSNPIVQYVKGKPVVSDRPITYREWRQSRPRFDANGKRVQ